MTGGVLKRSGPPLIRAVHVGGALLLTAGVILLTVGGFLGWSLGGIIAGVVAAMAHD